MVLVVRDNGVGIDETRWRQGKESFGKQLIGVLCKQLRATQEMEAQAGTAVTITIPREVAA
jgi:two-component sensor histidine kinase